MSRLNAFANRRRVFGVPGDDHLPEDTLHNLVDLRLPEDAVARCRLHVDSCVACRDELRALQNVVSLGALVLARRDQVPDLWPVVRAATIDAKAVRRRVLRQLRLPLIVWTLVAITAGVVVTEVVRDWSRRVATISAATAAMAAQDAAERDALLARQLMQLRKLQDSVATRDTLMR